MLKLLHIENIAVIEVCDIEFDRGFNVLTGETGAGKSIIIDAIGAVLGYRTTRDVIRNGSDKASVTAVFNDYNKAVSDWLEQNGYSTDDEEIIITREISLDGKNSARLNGKPITTSLLKVFGIMLVNILGQHDSQQLLDPEVHPVFIDRFAASEEYDALINEYSSVFDELCEKRTERKRLDIDETAKARQVEMLKFQIEELEGAALVDNEDEELLEQQKIIRESAKIAERIAEANISFNGDGEYPGICSLLSSASKALSQISEISEKLASVSNTVSELFYTADDVSSELRDLIESLDFSDADADRVEARLDVIHKLKRKYGNTVSDMLEFLDNAKKELSEIEFSEDRIIFLDNEIAKLEKKAFSLAEELLALRRKASEKFENAITKELSELDMKNAKFYVKISVSDELTSRGIDEVRFYIATNLGESEKPLEKIASGGELSRIMLALKNALDENDYVDTLIFDEIDTGVSGRAAQRIAEKLYKLSVKKQVLCVTHLSQISAMSDTHFKIEKREQNGRTYTDVFALDKDGRAEELARITAGSVIGETTLKNAVEMLSLAEKQKKLISEQ